MLPPMYSYVDGLEYREAERISNERFSDDLSNNLPAGYQDPIKVFSLESGGFSFWRVMACHAHRREWDS